MKPVPLAGTHRLYKSNMHGKLKKTRKGLRKGDEGVRGREESRKTVKICGLMTTAYIQNTIKAQIHIV